MVSGLLDAAGELKQSKGKLASRGTRPGHPVPQWRLQPQHHYGKGAGLPKGVTVPREVLTRPQHQLCWGKDPWVLSRETCGYKGRAVHRGKNERGLP